MTNREVFAKIFGEPLFKDPRCYFDPLYRGRICDEVPCSSCNWWDEEYVVPIKGEIND